MPDTKPVGATYSRVSNPNDTREATIASQGCTIPIEFRSCERNAGVMVWVGLDIAFACREADDTTLCFPW